MHEEMFYLALSDGLNMGWRDLLEMDQVDRIWLVKRLNRHHEETQRQMDAAMKRK